MFVGTHPTHGSQLASLAVAETKLSQQTSMEYRYSILNHMVEVDKATRPDPTMIDQQPQISWKMWPFLVDAMVDWHAKLGLEPQTLFLAVNIVNRYCARRIVYQKHFQLVGCTALWLAAKYEDKKSAVPSLRLLRQMAHNTYPEDMFVMMEGHILNTLDWSISHCTVDSFLRVLLSDGNPSPLLMSLASYIAEVTLYHKVFVGQDPLMIARAIHALSLHLLNANTPQGTSEADQKWQQWVPTLADLILTPPRAVLEKYRSPERLSVTRVVDGWVLRRQRQAQEEAAAKARAEAQAQAQAQAHRMSLGLLSRGGSTASLPMTPPPSAVRANQSQDVMASGQSSAYSSASEFTPPDSASFNSYQAGGDPYNGSPLGTSSLTSLTSLSSATSLKSVTSVAPHALGMLGSLSHSPPTTPLNLPKPFFRA